MHRVSYDTRSGLDHVRSQRHLSYMLILFGFIYLGIGYMGGNKDGSWMASVASGVMWGLAYIVQRNARNELIELPMRAYVHDNIEELIKGL